MQVAPDPRECLGSVATGTGVWQCKLAVSCRNRHFCRWVITRVWRSVLFRLSIVCFSLLVLSPRGECAGPTPDLPLAVPDSLWRPLSACVDSVLTDSLRARLTRNTTWARLIDQKKMAAGVVDITDPLLPRFAEVNGDAMMYAASLPKIAVLLAAFQAMEDGRLEQTPEVMQDLKAMIQVSSNSAATRSIDRAGGIEVIDSVLTSPRYQLYDKGRGGGLWVGKRYAKTGGVLRDPLKGLSHAASVRQVCRFYYLLATGRLVSFDRSREMLNVLSEPTLYHKFVHALRQMAPQAQLYRKSGSWRDWHSDSVLVWGTQWRRYILVGMVEYPTGGLIMEQLVPVVEEVLGH